MIAEYVGFPTELCALTEQFRQAPAETRADILIRVLRSLLPPVQSNLFIDVGQGVMIGIGEEIMLFLPGTDKLGTPDAKAVAQDDGLYMNGAKINPTRGSPLHPAMREIQELKNHRNPDGEIIQLSAFRQWYAKRSGKLIPLVDLKDPKRARRRHLSLISKKTAEELGL